MIRHQIWISSSIACGALLAVASLAQNTPPVPAGTLDFTTMPEDRGIYYHGMVGWKPLPLTVLMPFIQNDGLAYFNLGHAYAMQEMPGPHAYIQIRNDARPTFYLRGLSTNDLYLVRAVARADYRELRMPVSRHFTEWAHYRSKDVTELDVQAVSPDVISVKPRGDLKPGEYALAASVDPGNYWIRLGYDFGVIPSGAAK